MTSNKSSKIETERLLEEVEKLMQKNYKKPNVTIIDSKSSLSNKLT